MKLICIFFVVVVFVQIVIVGVVFVGFNLDDVKKVNMLKIGIEGIYVFFIFYDVFGKLVGFDVEIGEVIVKKIGVKLEFVEGKWDGLIVGFDVKCYDIVINQVGIIDVCKKKYDFFEFYIVFKVVFIVKQDNDKIKFFVDLKGKKLVQLLISNFGKIVEVNGVELVGIDGFDQLIQLVLIGCVDVMINDSLFFFDFKKYKLDVLVKVVVMEVNVDYLGVIICKGELELLVVINKVLVDIKVDGIYDVIFKKYFGEDVLK